MDPNVCGIFKKMVGTHCGRGICMVYMFIVTYLILIINAIQQIVLKLKNVFVYCRRCCSLNR